MELDQDDVIEDDDSRLKRTHGVDDMFNCVEVKHEWSAFHIAQADGGRSRATSKSSQARMTEAWRGQEQRAKKLRAMQVLCCCSLLRVAKFGCTFRRSLGKTVLSPYYWCNFPTVNVQVASRAHLFASTVWAVEPAWQNAASRTLCTKCDQVLESRVQVVAWVARLEMSHAICLFRGQYFKQAFGTFGAWPCCVDEMCLAMPYSDGCSLKKLFASAAKCQLLSLYFLGAA